MALIKLNDRAVKDVTEFGSISSLGDMTFISKATASSSASIEFTSGIDSTYKEYVFYFHSIHPQTDNVYFTVNFSTDGGSNYNVTKTTTVIQPQNDEAGTSGELIYESGSDLAQSTSDQRLTRESGADNDQCSAGYLHLFNPSSTTFVKHFITSVNTYKQNDFSNNFMVAGYGNTTSAINAIRFKFTSGNIDAGEILLFGIN
jgi:hypothetical protein